MTVALSTAHRSRLAPTTRPGVGLSGARLAVLAKRMLLALLALAAFSVAADAVLAAPHGSPASPVGSGPSRVVIGDSSGAVRYVVQRGDTSWSIASQLADPSRAVSAAAVLDAAMIDSDWVAGTELLIAAEHLFAG